MIIDAQVHVYVSGPGGWPGDRSHKIPAEVNGDQMVAAMDEVGVDGAICVSPWLIYRADTTFVESVYRKYPDRFRLVAPIDPNVDGVAERVEEWASTPGAVGIRLINLPGSEWNPDDVGVAAAIRTAASKDMPVNLFTWGHLSFVDRLAQLFPDAQLVVDHLGLAQPFAPPPPEDALAGLDHLLTLARHANVAVKVTGVCTYSHRPFPYEDLWEPIGRVIDAFGLHRCMWGTDWTRAVAVVSYEQGVTAFTEHWPLSRADKSTLMGETAKLIYRWNKA